MVLFSNWQFATGMVRSCTRALKGGLAFGGYRITVRPSRVHSHFSKHLDLKQPIRHVVVALSGGVDSSVTALLVKNAPEFRDATITALHMRNWDASNEENAPNCGEVEERDAKSVAISLGLRFKVVSFAQDYWNNVFSPSLAQLEAGKTPNPDILCNREIKFSRLLRFAKDSLGADVLATGHYCRIACGDHAGSNSKGNSTLSGNQLSLVRGLDVNRDQSYFLSGIDSVALKSVVFPLGGFTKEEVRDLARAEGLITAEKKTSTGLCFVGKRRFSDFIGQYLDVPSGNFVDIVSGQRLGYHKGHAFYTIGQNAKISGLSSKYYVEAKDVESNTLYVTSENQRLKKRKFEVQDEHWISGHPPSELDCGPLLALHCRAKIRYRTPSVACVVTRSPNNRSVLHVTGHCGDFKAVTPGQV